MLLISGASGVSPYPVTSGEHFQRYNVWVEPALTAEWVRLMQQYAAAQGRKLDDATIAQGMAWSEPGRVARVSRERAARLVEDGSLRCVWSGRTLTRTNLDIDHCFPWSSWPCSDLWNLVPSNRNVNQNEKRGRLPTDLALRRAKDRIIDWWNAGYIRTDNPLLNRAVHARGLGDAAHSRSQDEQS